MSGEVYEDSPWWDRDKKGDPHERLIPLFRNVRSSTAILVGNTRRLVTLFENGTARSSYAQGDSQWASARAIPLEEESVTFNHAANIIETMHAKLTKTEIAPMFLTEGGNWYQRQRAKDLQKAMDGEFDESDIQRVKEDCAMDALVTDHAAGAALVSSYDGKIKIEYCPIEDFYFDPAETRYKNPRTLFRRVVMDRYQAAHVFARKPKKDEDQDDRLYGSRISREHAILSAKRVHTYDGMHVGDDQIELVEAWHRPSGEGAGDGRHVIAVDGATLLDEDWDRDGFPVAFMVLLRRGRDVWGRSVMRRLVPAQREHDLMSRKIQVANRMTGSHIIAPRGANVNPRMIDNDLGTFFEYDGSTPPMSFNPDPISPQAYQYRSSLPVEMRQSVGMNDMSTSGSVPAGLSQASGKALQVFEDVEDQRMKPMHEAIERWIVEISWLVVYEARYLSQRDPDFSSRYVGKRSAERIKWADVLMDKDDFVIQTFPTNALSKHPAARLAQVQMLAQSGMISLEQARRLIDFPDIEAQNDIDEADSEIILKNLDRMVLTGKYTSPLPHDNLAEIIRVGSKFVNKLRVEDEEGELQPAIDMINGYLLDAEALQKSLTQQPPQGVPGPVGTAPGAPPGPGGPMPPEAPPGPEQLMPAA